jgi:hypothetical protein
VPGPAIVDGQQVGFSITFLLSNLEAIEPEQRGQPWPFRSRENGATFYPVARSWPEARR